MILPPFQFDPHKVFIPSADTYIRSKPFKFDPHKVFIPNADTKSNALKIWANSLNLIIAVQALRKSENPNNGQANAKEKHKYSIDQFLMLRRSPLCLLTESIDFGIRISKRVVKLFIFDPWHYNKHDRSKKDVPGPEDDLPKIKKRRGLERLEKGREKHMQNKLNRKKFEKQQQEKLQNPCSVDSGNHKSKSYLKVLTDSHANKPSQLKGNIPVAQSDRFRTEKPNEVKPRTIRFRNRSLGDRGKENGMANEMYVWRE